MKRPLGIQGGTGQGHGSQRWPTGPGGGFCGLCTKEKQVEGGGQEGSPSLPVSASLISSPAPAACTGAVGGGGG